MQPPRPLLVVVCPTVRFLMAMWVRVRKLEKMMMETSQRRSLLWSLILSMQQHVWSFSNANPSTRRNSESRALNRDDIPSFDLFVEGDPEFDFMYGDDMVRTKTGKQVTQPTTTAPIPGVTTKMDVSGNKMSSSSLEKKNRRKRAAVELNPGKKPKRIKLEEDVGLAYETYVVKKLAIKRPPIGASCELPPFIQIAGFHITYDDFYESLKPRGHIANTIMTMWTYQFNHNCQAAWKLNNNIIKKFAFTAMMTDKLIIDPKHFK
ncbi:hypothetical protein SORBI_3001G243901 [Sorghum bicolor]|uniref:Ubiquitin-like protease family profile domain-containing protein n=1 Tax=Sorghum bicolor TaxID=4558 RepID=A0A1Z5S7P1_SORBI|nr:hypothetical protein SORBI_3001G243901 [Sorghum bicolor]